MGTRDGLAPMSTGDSRPLAPPARPVRDYWIVNLLDEALEVYRQPVRAPEHRFGWKYGNIRLLRRGATVSPLAVPRRRMRVADLLP
jgi:hypothetical protein